MAQLTYLQFGHSMENDGYAVTASFDGHPGTPGPLIYNPAGQQFEAALTSGNPCETLTSFQGASSHLAAFNEWQLAHIVAGPTHSLKGGGIIKTTKFPPPNKEYGPLFNPVNAGLLGDLYLSNLSILRNGPGQNFIVSLEVKNKPGHNYPFQILSATIEASELGRPMAIIFVKIGPGTNTQATVTVNYNNANTMSFNTPCSIVMDKSPLNINFDYSKSGWFYMLP